MGFDPKEVATIETSKGQYSDWETVSVAVRITEWYPTCQFETSEESEMPVSWDKLQLAPGDHVKVFLGGEPAVDGYIIERHSAYDKRNHAVRLVAVGKTFDLVNSTVPPDQLGNHDGKTWRQFATDLTKHLGIKVEPAGKIDDTPLENIQVQPGETIANALEKAARMKVIMVGSTKEGNLLALGQHEARLAGELVEGDNILSANCAIRDEFLYRNIIAYAQKPGTNLQWGDEANKLVSRLKGSSNRNRYMTFNAELAANQHDLDNRALMELKFTEGGIIEAHITVQGWFKPDGDLWQAGEYYWVKSPSLMLKTILGCRATIYQQSNGGGTTTTLEMVDPAHMNGNPNLGPAT